MVMVMMVVMSFFVVRPRMVHVVHDQFGAVAHAFHTWRRLHRVLAPARAPRMMVMVMMMLTAGMFRRRGRLLVQVLPRLSVVPVQSAAALGPGRVQRSYRVSVRRRPVTIMFGTAIPAKRPTAVIRRTYTTLYLYTGRVKYTTG